MWKQAISLLTHRKKSMVLMLLLVAISAFLLQTVGPLFNAAIDQTFEEGVAAYGRHHAIFYDMTPEQLAQLEAAPTVRTMGRMYNYGVYRLRDHGQQLTFGGFDETGLELGNIRVLEGRLPEKPNEVALEAHLQGLPADGALQLGDTLWIEGEDGETPLIITGWIADYSGMWIHSINPLPGVNDYPQALLAAEDPWAATGNVNAMLHLLEVDKTVHPVMGVLQLSVEIGGVDGEHLQFNDFAYDTAQAAYLYWLKLLRNLFVGLSGLSVILLLYVAFGSYLRPYLQSARTMYSLGAGHPAVLLPLLLWVSLLAGGGILLGTLLSGAFAWGIRGVISYTWAPFGQWSWMLLLWAALLVQAVWFFIRRVRRWQGKDWSAWAEQGVAEGVELGRSMILPLAALHLHKNWKRMLCACLLLAMYLTLLFCMQNQQLAWAQRKTQPVVRTTSMDSHAFQQFGEFELSAKSLGYPIAQVNALGELPGVTHIRKAFYAKPASIIYPGSEEDPYYQLLYAQYSMAGLDSGIEVEAIPEDILAFGEAYTIVVLDQWNTEEFLQKVPEANIPGLGEAVVFCPKLEGGYSGTGDLVDEFMGQTGIQTAENTAFRAGEPVRFGMLETEGIFSEEVLDPQHVTYREEQLHMAQVFNFGLDMDNGSNWDVGVISVVITEETAETLSIAREVSMFRVFMEEGLPRSTYEAIEAGIYRVALQLQGPRVDSYLRQHDYYERMMQTMRVSFAAISGVVVTFIGFALMNILYETLLQRIHMFGILRAVGYRRRTLWVTVWLELMVYWLWICLLTAGLGYLGVDRYSYYVTGLLLKLPEAWDLFLTNLLIGLGVSFLLLTLLAEILSRTVFSKSTSDCIRFAE